MEFYDTHNSSFKMSIDSSRDKRQRASTPGVSSSIFTKNTLRPQSGISRVGDKISDFKQISTSLFRPLTGVNSYRQTVFTFGKDFSE